MEKIGVSPKVFIGGQNREIDLSFSSKVEESGNQRMGVKTFTGILDEPIVLAGDEYTALSTIRDSDVNQDLSFELKM